MSEQIKSPALHLARQVKSASASDRLARQEHLFKVARLISHGGTPESIAAALNVSYSQAKKDITVVLSKSANNLNSLGVERHRASLLARTQYVGDLALESFKISRKGYDEEGNEIVKPGNNEFLRTINQTLKDEREMCGLDAPKAVPVDNSDKISVSALMAYFKKQQDPQAQLPAGSPLALSSSPQIVINAHRVTQSSPVPTTQDSEGNEVAPVRLNVNAGAMNNNPTSHLRNGLVTLDDITSNSNPHTVLTSTPLEDISLDESIIPSVDPSTIVDPSPKITPKKKVVKKRKKKVTQSPPVMDKKNEGE